MCAQVGGYFNPASGNAKRDPRSNKSRDEVGEVGFSPISMAVIMPNHVHGIITVGAQFIGPGPDGEGCLNPGSGSPTFIDRAIINQGVMNHAPTLGEIIRTFKAVSARQVRKNSPTAFFWQRNYYEHVIRSEDEWTRTRKYIEENPMH